MQFGCFVQLEGLRGRHEGLVHISQVNIKARQLYFSSFLSRNKANTGSDKLTLFKAHCVEGRNFQSNRKNVIWQSLLTRDTLSNIHRSCGFQSNIVINTLVWGSWCTGFQITFQVTDCGMAWLTATLYSEEHVSQDRKQVVMISLFMPKIWQMTLNTRITYSSLDWIISHFTLSW